MMEDEKDGNYGGCDNNDKREPDNLLKVENDNGNYGGGGGGGGVYDDKQRPEYKPDDEVDWRKRQFPRANMVYPRIKTVFEQEMTKKCEEVYMCLALLKANKRSLCAQLQADTEQVVVVVAFLSP